ncbi:16132_t:CDS:2 [Gigaspora margarita]|uniref:16132_t:CDS:1 n=1 Tax=Gigaspora margarita TaxID=4874 RepID=A0ABN7W6G6_GIGMA|nr:16132_t:CDS:2 [Gigaspora margarita]
MLMYWTENTHPPEYDAPDSQIEKRYITNCNASKLRIDDISAINIDRVLTNMSHFDDICRCATLTDNANTNIINILKRLDFTMSKEFTILYFAFARDAINISSEIISFSFTSSSLSFQDFLRNRHENLGNALENSIFAINMQYVDKDNESIMVKPGDEVVIILPVSGC